MVYASIKEAWGIDGFCREPPDNPYVVKDPIQDKANFKQFEKQHFSMDELSRANVVPSKNNRKKKIVEPSVDSTIDSRNDSTIDSTNNHKQRKYFLEKNDEYSEICSDVSSRDSCKQEMDSYLKGKKIKFKNSKPNKSIIKNVHEGFENHYHNSRNHDNCSNLLEHLRNCRICQEGVEEYSKNTFIKEFIIFAGSGIIMFLFLDLLRKIAQRAP